MTRESDNMDSKLWERLRKGETEALRQIYESHIESLFRFGCRLTDDEDFVKDCIHEVFIDIFNKRLRLGITDSIRPYLFTCVKRKIFKSLNKSKLTSSITDKVDKNLAEGSPEEDHIRAEFDDGQKRMLEKAINELSPRQKEVIYLRYIEGLSYEDVQGLMGMSYQSVRNLVSSAIKKLQLILNP